MEEVKEAMDSGDAEGKGSYVRYTLGTPWVHLTNTHSHTHTPESKGSPAYLVGYSGDGFHLGVGQCQKRPITVSNETY